MDKIKTDRDKHTFKMNIVIAFILKSSQLYFRLVQNILEIVLYYLQLITPLPKLINMCPGNHLFYMYFLYRGEKTSI